MVWCGIEGHDQVVAQFRRSVAQGRLASSFLFIGPPGVGKRLFAVRLAQALMCETRPETALEPCLVCSACQQIHAGGHPDVDIVSRPPGKAVIPVELFIGDREHRSQEGLCHRLALKPSVGRRRVAIIDDADYLNPEGANCLLKTLEEPPPGSVLILIGTSLQRQLPTIRSRCQVVRFQRLSDEFVESYLQQNAIMAEGQPTQHRVELAEGSLEQAAQFAGVEWVGFWDALRGRLRQASVDTQELAKWTLEFVEAAGPTTPVRRDRLRLVVRLFLLFYRQRLFARVGAIPPGSEACCAGSSKDSVEDDARRIDRCSDALVQIDANANLATLIECWIDDLFPLNSPVPAGRAIRNR